MGAPLKRNPIEYDAIARSALLDLLIKEHALVWLEVHAKLADRPYPGLSGGINPHHLTNARRQLLQQALIEEIHQSTRGGRRIAVLALADRRGRETAFQRAAARKRLLQTRYLSWATPGPGDPNLIGAAGERVAHASLQAAAEVGYRLVRPEGGNITSLFGSPVPGGPLDDAAYLVVLDKQQLPTAATILIEVKNVRHWIYPSNWELFQLLDKAARIQLAHSDRLFIPLMICRKAQYTTFTMARDLGFIVFQTEIQPILPRSEAPPRAVEQVNRGLGYNLVRTADAHEGLAKALREILPRVAFDTATRCSTTAPALANFYRILRDPELSDFQRRAEIERLKQAAIKIPNLKGQW